MSRHTDCLGKEDIMYRSCIMHVYIMYVDIMHIVFNPDLTWENTCRERKQRETQG